MAIRNLDIRPEELSKKVTQEWEGASRERTALPEALRREG